MQKVFCISVAVTCGYVGLNRTLAFTIRFKYDVEFPVYQMFTVYMYTKTRFVESYAF